MITYHK